ncbi:MAG TPA: hypothetical protein VKP66_13980 [Steroidobacteraceae bacterium]|nr:hypothetical protein [Steroidobacteraceae bacterium]
MCDRYSADDHSANLLERRWFAAGRAAAETQAECDALAQVLDLARAAWLGARTRLLQLEALREALGEELAQVDERERQWLSEPERRSAA